MEDSFKKLKEINDLYQKNLTELNQSSKSIEDLGRIMKGLLAELLLISKEENVDED